MAPRGRGGRRTATQNHKRQDRDGDLNMGGSAATGRTNKSRNPAGTMDLTKTQSQGRINKGNQKRNTACRTNAPTSRGKLVEFRISGWENSRVSSHSDQGQKTLERWLNEKMNKGKLGSAMKRQVRLTKTRREGDVLIASVPEVDAKALARMHKLEWAGATLIVERLDGQGNTQQPQKYSQGTMMLKELFRDLLLRRYDGETKLLDLSSLYQDPQLVNFEGDTRNPKFFAALMKVMQEFYPDNIEGLYAAVQSVSLANNDLVNLDQVKDLSYALPRLQNLDLSNNRFEKIEALDVWRRRFRDLRQLVVTGNPFVQNEPGYAQELMNRYPNLRMLNDTQVRTEEDVARRRTTRDLPLPIKGPLFVDQDSTAVTFITNWFAGFDNDRAGLAQLYYDDNSQFSLAINGSAPRDPAGTVTTESQEWGVYMKYSRNLKKVSGLGTRMGRNYRGTAQIAQLFNDLPQTQHPDLIAESGKWMIESYIQQGLSHPNTPGGVNGLHIDIHGEFDEIDPRTGNVKKRSMDHNITIGPGLGPPGSIRVLTHMLTIRAYGGTQAFVPDAIGSRNSHTPPPEAELEPYQIAGLDQAQAMALCNTLSAATGMIMQYCKDCLDQAKWDLGVAGQIYESVKPNLGAEAYLKDRVPK